MAADWPGPDGRADEQDDVAGDQDDNEQDDVAGDQDDVDEDDVDEDQEDQDQDDEPAPARPGRAAKAAGAGAGWVLGVLFWGWVALPFIKAGPGEVKKTLMAKFFNRAPDGTELP
ncbi:hypothetical protein C5N14_30940 [Micromonospora sp. MW-13]|uniref:hypothetical protein n=1 Tax=Micromonospora sp. MW-13 TaxID=2094022 RepID=UPI000E44C342|nr:hypothetical protein [Micromonospora sp. MW-13]RGC65010.1 hypothetical protein C5N14_30940 [Micromonospora sp. MW-13]